MKANFTPGPWTAVDNFDRIEREEDGNLITKLICPMENSSLRNISNAKLMAAAPDLLHALESFVVSMDYSSEQFAGHNEAYRRDVCMKRALDAIKKATE